MCKIGCNLRCFLAAIIVALLVGVVSAVLSFTAVITVTPAFLWVLFGIAVVLLAVLFITAAFADSGRLRACLCADTGYLLTGILGTILTSVILLGVPFAATSVLGTVVVGALLFFFTFTVATLACTVKCLTDCDFCDD